MRNCSNLFCASLVFLAAQACIRKSVVVVTPKPTPTNTSKKRQLKKIFDYKSPATILKQLGVVRGTYIVTDFLFKPENELRAYCVDLSKRGYNLAYVNVQARGYVLKQQGFDVSVPDYGQVLIPGHPKVKVPDPLLVIREECEQQNPPIAVVPWFEYNAMAEQAGGVDVDVRGKGFDEQGALATVGFYNSGSDIPTTYRSISQTFYPFSWYLKKQKTNEIYLSGSNLRWLDMRKNVVADFLYAFAKHMADIYGPLQNWDRMRFSPDESLGLDSVVTDKNNAQTQMVERISKMLRQQNGALWVTVVKHWATKYDGKFNENYGQHWASSAWANAVQLFVPMTYFEDYDTFKADIDLMLRESNEIGFQFTPIIGLDKPITEMRQPKYATILNKQRDYAKSKIGKSKMKGFVDWYYAP